MTDKEINQLIITTLINLGLIVLLIREAWDGNDKAIILVIFLYPLMAMVNGILWMSTKSKAFMVTTISLLILFLPVLFIATMS